MSAVEAGTLVAGRYRVVAELGAGGMGVVLRARDERLERDVALKVLPPSSALDGMARARLVREARAAAALSHPGIVHVYDVGETENGGAYIAMELVSGKSLRALSQEGALSREEIVRGVVDVARTLAFAHRAGVVHRDVKPDNVMRRADGRVVVLDFGLAKSRDASVTITATGDVIGTPAYLSPEQARGESLAASDQFALAVMFFELLVGRLPWSGNMPTAILASILADEPLAAHALDPSLPAELDVVLGRALAKDPAQRFETMDAFADAIAALPSLVGRVTHEGIGVAKTIASTPRGALAAPTPRTPLSVPEAFTPLASRSEKGLRSQEGQRTEGEKTEGEKTETEKEGEERGARIVSPIPPKLLTTTSAARRPRAPWIVLGALVLAGAGATLATTRPWERPPPPPAAPMPLAVRDAVLACPPLVASGAPEPAGWLGAAAATALCDRARVVLGGDARRVRQPFALLALPAEPIDDGPLDPYGEPDARARALAAARSASAWLDGTVVHDDDGMHLHVVVRAPDGRAAGAADATRPMLRGAAEEVVRALAAARTLPRATRLDAEFARWSGLGSVDDALLAQAAESAPAGHCEALARLPATARPPTTQRACPDVPGPPAANDAMSSPELARAAMWPVPAANRAHVADTLAARRATEASALGRADLAAAEARLRRHDADFAGARRAALAAIHDVPDHRWAWPTLVYAQYETPQHEPACLGWTYVRPNAVAAWGNLGIAEAFGSDRALAAEQRSSLLDPDDVSAATDLGVMYLVRDQHQSARTLAARLLDGAPGGRVAGEILDAACDAAEVSFDASVTRNVALVARLDRFGVTEQQDGYLPLLALEPALATGRAAELGDAYVARALDGDHPRLAPDSVAVFHALALVLVASPAARTRGMARIHEMTTRADWRQLMPAQVAALRGAELYAAGDHRGAALAWRPLATGTSGADRMLAHVVAPVLDELGDSELAERYDAALLAIGTPWNGASLAHVRMAKRALAQGDVTRARELAQRVVDGWSASDVPLPAVREMAALLAHARAP